MNIKTNIILFVLCDIVFSEFTIFDTDLNETCRKFKDADPNFEPFFNENDQGYIFEAKPLLACGNSIEPPLFNITKRKVIALIQRGNCTFGHKISVAELSGYSGVIIYNYENSIFHMGADKSSSSITIPSRMVSLMTGIQLRKLYTFTESRQNFILTFYDNNDRFNSQFYIIVFLGFVSLGFFLIGIGFGIKLCRDAYKRHANRLRKCHLKKIPLKKFVKGQDPYETCAICLEDFKDGEKLRILPCNHAYHANCIDPWLLKQKRNCPICKYRIKIAGRDDDSDSVDDVPPATSQTVPSEHTPLINASQPSNSTRYLINGDTEINFIPEHNSSTSCCYDNLTCEVSEPKATLFPASNDRPSPNTNQSEDDTLTDLTKIV